MRTDQLSSKIGKTDNWLLAANFTIDIPNRLNPLSLLPIKIPLKIFTDVGTYAEAWDAEEGEGRLLFDAGLQISLFQSTVNAYIPLLYSKPYRDYFQSVPGNGFGQRISFSIDLHRISLRKWIHEKN